MPLNQTQYKLLEGIQSNLRHGDITEIASRVGLTREYVGRALSLKTEDFNDAVIKAAIDLFSEREEEEKRLIEKLPAQLPDDKLITSFSNVQEK